MLPEQIQGSLPIFSAWAPWHLIVLVLVIKHVGRDTHAFFIRRVECILGESLVLGSFLLLLTKSSLFLFDQAFVFENLSAQLLLSIFLHCSAKLTLEKLSLGVDEGAVVLGLFLQATGCQHQSL